MKFTPETLPDNPLELKLLIVELQAQYEKQVSLLIEQIRLLRHNLFGVKSEKLPAAGTMQLIPLFDLPEPEALEPELVIVPTHSRKKPGRKPLPADLPRIDVLHDISDEEKICAGGCTLSRTYRRGGHGAAGHYSCPDPGAAPYSPQVCLLPL